VTGSRRMPGANAQTRRFTSILPTNIMTLGALARLFEPSRDRQEAPPRMPLVFSSVALPPGRGSAPCAVCGCFRRRRAPASKWICWRKRRSLLGLMPRNLYRRVEVLFPIRSRRLVRRVRDGRSSHAKLWKLHAQASERRARQPSLVACAAQQSGEKTGSCDSD
jgi:hypothetical protein